MIRKIITLVWTRHALEELPYGVDPEDVENSWNEKHSLRRGREKGIYESMCSVHGRILFLVLVKEKSKLVVKTVRDATREEKDLFKRL